MSWISHHRPFGPRPRPSFIELFTPKTITVLREGYGLASLRADLLAGLTVAIVALPLSMAIAIASGATPERGLFTTVIGGGLISLLGGSRFQIGGPAAFTVVVATTIANHGFDGLLLATFMAGVILMLQGFPAPWELNQVHSISGHGGLHFRHCGYPVRGTGA